jgi:hypothetical protein
MNDEQLEQRLRRVRPAGPSAELRARIMSARPAARAWPWAVAAAALLALAVSLQVSAGRVLEGVRPAHAGPAVDATPDLAALREAQAMDDADVRAMELSRELERRLGRTEEEPVTR